MLNSILNNQRWQSPAKWVNDTKWVTTNGRQKIPVPRAAAAYDRQLKKEIKQRLYLFFLGSVNHLLLVTNSSLNFLIYCCMASRFRSALHDLFLNMNYAFCKQDKQDQSRSSRYSQADGINRLESNRYD